MSGQANGTRRGSLLVASPAMLDPNFMHTVILICADGDAGALGLVLNRPTEFAVPDLASDVPLLAGRTDTLWSGGPVATRELHVLHATGAEIEGAMEIAHGVAMDGDADLLARTLRTRRSDAEIGADGGADMARRQRVRFFMGYAGWGSGQLEAELEEGSWVVCPGSTAAVFDEKPETLWRRVLRAQGGAISGLADLPPDPSWN